MIGINNQDTQQGISFQAGDLYKRVLIVDDEPNIALMLADSLESMTGSYQVETAASADEAISLLRQSFYNLVITDYKMPGMNGLDLARVARRISPETQIVLMTAFGTEGLKDAAGKLQLNGYIAKPFSIAQVREIVEKAIASTSQTRAEKDLQQSTQRVYHQLQSLQADTGARCVIMLSASGYAVDTAGQTGGLDVSTLSALVAANFIAASELAKLLGRGSVFKSSYHEGQDGTDYNIYAYDVNGDYILAVVFGVESKPGVVWFYTKQIAAALAGIIAEQAAATGLQLAQNGAGAGNDYRSGQVLSVQQAIAAGLLPAEFSFSDQNFENSASLDLAEMWREDETAAPG